MSSTIPGAYETTPSEDGSDEVDLSALVDAAMDEDSDDQDSDFQPGDTADEVSMDEGEEEEDADAGRGTGGQLQIAFDPRSRQILLVDSAGNATRLTSQHLQGSSLTLRRIRAMMEARFGGGGGGDDDEEEDDEDDDDEEEEWGQPRRSQKRYYDEVTVAQEAGINLERGGEFGSPPKKYAAAQRKFVDYSSNLAQAFRAREYDYRRTPKSSIGDFTVPNSSGTEVSQFQSKVYSGQFSSDATMFYAASQDFSVYIYDTRTPPSTGSKSVTDSAPRSGRRALGSYWQHRSSLKLKKVVKGQDRNMRWTITDAELSNDNEYLIYSSITPRVHLVKTGQGESWETDDHEQSTLDFAAGIRGSPSFGIWSVRFSNDGSEVVAGANDGQIFVYDIKSNRTILRVNAHKDDVNAVAFADTSSSNLLLSGSDDSFIKVWDRRSLSGERASGTLVGHTEGVCFLAPKGDGRYCISNGKDQALKLWDLRKMVSDESFDKLRLDKVDYGIPGWDYRQAYYSKPKYLEHPHDVSVQTYRGHAVLRTLIRCHFSPIATTNQRYLYSGSTDGIIHIWSLDGRVVQTLDRRQTHPLINVETGEYNDPSRIDLRRTTARGTSHSTTVRDVSWHPYESSIMSTAWEGRGGIEGSIAQHDWKGAIAGETLEDQAERAVLEQSM